MAFFYSNTLIAVAMVGRTRSVSIDQGGEGLAGTKPLIRNCFSILKTYNTKESSLLKKIIGPTQIKIAH